jgi:hypothetical protein
MRKRSLEEWDAEIEEDFRRVVRETNVAGRHRDGRRHIGCSMAFMADLCRLIPGRSAVPIVIAMLIYRRTIACHSRTVTLPGAQLAELGIDRPKKSRALALLARAGFIRIEPTGPGQTAKVTLLRSG